MDFETIICIIVVVVAIGLGLYANHIWEKGIES
jgi:hypothetical protein